MYRFNLTETLENELLRLFPGINLNAETKDINDNNIPFQENGRDYEYETFSVHPLTTKNEEPIESAVFNRINRKKKTKFQKQPRYCVFCKNNEMPKHTYNSHRLKDLYGHTSCPILRQYRCPICGAIGDDAHTIKYCPLNLTSSWGGRLTKVSK